MCDIEKFEKAERISTKHFSGWYVVKEIRNFKGNREWQSSSWSICCFPYERMFINQNWHKDSRENVRSKKEGRTATEEKEKEQKQRQWMNE